MFILFIDYYFISNNIIYSCIYVVNFLLQQCDKINIYLFHL